MMRDQNEKWVHYRLEELAVLISGRTPDRDHKEYYSSTGTPWVKIENLDQGVVIDTSEYLSEQGRAKVNLVPEGSVLFSIVGTVGKVGIAGKEVASNQQIVSFVFDENIILPMYGYYLLRYHAQEIRKLANQTTMALISRKTLGQYRVAVPEKLELQRHIADSLKRYERYAQNKEAFRRGLEDYEMLLFQRIFGREIRCHERLELKEYLQEPVFGPGPGPEKFEEGDILLHNGRLRLVNQPEDSAGAEKNVLCVRADKEQLLPEVLSAYLKLPKVRAVLYAERKPGDSRKRPIRGSELERMEIPYFSMKRQRDFAACFRKLQEIKRASDQETAYAWKLFFAMSRQLLAERKDTEKGANPPVLGETRAVVCRTVLAVLGGWCPGDFQTGEYCKKRQEIFRAAGYDLRPLALSLVYAQGQEEYLLLGDSPGYHSDVFCERWENPLDALRELLKETETGRLRDVRLVFQGPDGMETEEYLESDRLEQMAERGIFLLQEAGGLGACGFLFRNGNRGLSDPETKGCRRRIRMVGLDLDGTLFNEKKVITGHTKEVIQKAIEQGVTVLPATGRPECGLPREILQIPGVRYALTSNGARILDLLSGETVYEQFIPWDVALRAIAVMEQWEGCVWEAYIHGNIYVEAENYRFLSHPDMTPALKEYIHKSRTPMKGLKRKIERERIGLEKLHMLFENTGMRDQKIKELSRLFPELAVSCATTFNVEINSARAGKGIGLAALGRILGIEREEIMACGDATNDWDMLRAVGFPVVMENADDRTKQLGAFITRSNEEDGVAYALERFVIVPPSAGDRE